tara:strand:+ start:179 stop:835 length:657 start_codon:yes stop_codon:yes gene_type:complete
MITLTDIEKLIPTLQETWNPIGPDGRVRYRKRDSSENRDIWQSVFLQRETAKGMVNILNDLPDDFSKMTVLDAGCDAGLFSVVLSQLFKNVIGIDYDEISVERANQTLEVFKNAGFDVSNVKIEHKDFRKSYMKNPSNINALFNHDSGTGPGKPPHDKNKTILDKVDFILITDRGRDAEYMKASKEELEKYNFKVELHKSQNVPVEDVIIGRKYETNI